jgi:hypothetical protein
MVAKAAKRRSIQITNVDIDGLKRADWNPRFIRRDRLENLKQSIQDDPEFMWERPILALADGTVYAGNQRLQACMELGWRTVPAIVGNITDEQLARARAVRDNNSWGEWDDEALVTFIKALTVEDIDPVPTLGFTDAALAAIMRESEPRSMADGLRVDNPTEEDDDGSILVARERDAPTPSEYLDTWERSVIRQIVLYYQTEQYSEMTGLLADIRHRLDVDNNTDAVTYVLKEYHANHCTPGEGARLEPVQVEVGSGE